MILLRLLKIVLLLGVVLYLLAFTPNDTFAEETGYVSTKSCITNGSSCDNMKVQDALYNSWTNYHYEEILANPLDISIPEQTIIDEIQIKLRIKTSTPGWTWFVSAWDATQSKFISPLNCSNFGQACRYNTAKQFNSLDTFTYKWLNNNPLHIFTRDEIIDGNFMLKLWQSGGIKSTDIDVLLLNIVYHYKELETTPSVSPTPEPFLDLPWDYEAKGLSFSDAANAINSYFDHEYPLLSFSWAVPEQPEFKNITVTYNQLQDQLYSSHDGYDYGSPGKAHYGGSVLAAAGGKATFVNTCGACGNAIHIDHGNGYQTRYYHLQPEGLVTNDPDVPAAVTARQQIGKIGFSGNVSPQGENGAHIHFMVIQDKNHDGNFDDNLPDGLTDPYGWQSTEQDPWENFTYTFNELIYTGNKSYYLWKKKIDGLKEDLPSNGGVFTVSKFTASFPEDTTRDNGTVTMQSSPIADISDTVRSIGSTINVTVADLLGQEVSLFTKPITLTVHYSDKDITNVKPETLSIYSTTDFVNWEKEDSILDLFQKNVTTDINHLTYFALGAERIDSIAPTTNAMIEGAEGEKGWYRSDVRVTLISKDNEGGLGVQYTAYRIGNGEWQEYTTPILLLAEGPQTLSFYSADNDGNIEEIKTLSIIIDRSAPEMTLQVDTQTIWPPDGRMVPVIVMGTALDTNLSEIKFMIQDEYGSTMPTIFSFGQTVLLEAFRNGYDKDGRLYTINAVAYDKAGNETKRETQIRVTHDERNKK